MDKISTSADTKHRQNVGFGSTLTRTPRKKSGESNRKSEKSMKTRRSSKWDIQLQSRSSERNYSHRRHDKCRKEDKRKKRSRSRSVERKSLHRKHHGHTKRRSRTKSRSWSLSCDTKVGRSKEKRDRRKDEHDKRYPESRDKGNDMEHQTQNTNNSAHEPSQGLKDGSSAITPYNGLIPTFYQNQQVMPTFWNQDNFILLFVGQPSTGKTTQLQKLLTTRGDYLWGKFDWVFFFSPIPIPGIKCVEGQNWFRQVSMNTMNEIIGWTTTLPKRNEGVIRRTKLLFIFDDVMSSIRNLWKDIDFQNMFDYRRHISDDTITISMIFTAQRFVNQIPRDLRRGVTDLVLLPTNDSDINPAIDSIGCNVKIVRPIALKVWERCRYEFLYLTNQPRIATSLGYTHVLTIF